MMKRFSLFACTFGAFFLPVGSFAATLTPQQVLDRGLILAVQEQRSVRSSFELDIRSSSKLLKKDLYSSGDEARRVRLALNSESFMRSGGNMDGVFTLRVPQFDMSAGGQPIQVQNPFTLEVRLINKVVYVRVSDVAPLLLEQLPVAAASSSEPNLRALIGTWIKIDPSELGQDAQDLSAFSPEVSSVARASSMDELRALVAPGSVFQITGTEKRYKNEAGEQLLRLRVRINPRFVDRILDAEDAQAVKAGGKKMTAKARATARKGMVTSFAPLKLVAVVNMTKGTLDRVEGAYVKSESVYRYEWKNNKEKKYYNGKTTTDIRFGVSMQAIADRQISVPEPSLSFKTLMDQWKEAMMQGVPTSTPEAVEIPQAPSPTPGLSELSPVTAADHIRGDAQAPVTVTVYSDYEDPFSQRHVASIQRLLTEFPHDVRVVYRNYPLSSIHPNAQVAAEASECAGRVGGSMAFWSMHDLLFVNSTNLGSASFTNLASQIGLNPQAFELCMNAHEGADKVNQDVTTGNNAWVDGTPATFINGSLMSGAMPYEDLRQSVMRAIAQR